MVDEFSFDESVVKKDDLNDEEGIENPSMKDIMALPRYIETELPPKYGYSYGNEDDVIHDVQHSDRAKLTEMPFDTAKTAF